FDFDLSFWRDFHMLYFNKLVPGISSNRLQIFYRSSRDHADEKLLKAFLYRPVSTEEVPGTIWGAGTTTGTSSRSALSTAVSPLREWSRKKVPVKLLGSVCGVNVAQPF
ncbi:hypothetical protein P3471_25020, partial [Vibrio parahaemolyticus]|nr:hypothetical protein [Vibrio parahaemolyticus]